jgi:hypothetical protein
MSGYTIPNVITRDARGERIMDVYSHLLSERVVYLGTGIDAGVANALIAQLLHLEGSLSPRSTSDRYCTETPARAATSASVSPRSWRRRRSCSPTRWRHSGSIRGARRASGAGNGIGSAMSTR